MAEYQVNLGKKQEDNYYPVTISAGYNGFFLTAEPCLTVLSYSTTTGVQEIINIDSQTAALLQQMLMEISMARKCST